MPFIGLSPFIQMLFLKRYGNHRYVSMPFIGLSPFLLWQSNDRKVWRRCVNALYRAFSISTYWVLFLYPKLRRKCQCPLSGFLHFYWETNDRKVWRRLRVNALYRAFSISTDNLGREEVQIKTCQCPLSGFLHFYNSVLS